MIEKIIEMLSTGDYYGESELIEIAKGKYQLNTTVKGVREQKKREKQWQLRKK